MTQYRQSCTFTSGWTHTHAQPSPIQRLSFLRLFRIFPAEAFAATKSKSHRALICDFFCLLEAMDTQGGSGHIVNRRCLPNIHL